MPIRSREPRRSPNVLSAAPDTDTAPVLAAGRTPAGRPARPHGIRWADMARRRVGEGRPTFLACSQVPTRRCFVLARRLPLVPTHARLPEPPESRPNKPEAFATPRTESSRARPCCSRSCPVLACMRMLTQAPGHHAREYRPDYRAGADRVTNNTSWALGPGALPSPWRRRSAPEIQPFPRVLPAPKHVDGFCNIGLS